jgi:hypothetical protein
MRWVSGVLALAMLGAFTAQATPPGDKPRTEKRAPRPTMLLAGETGEEWPMSLPDAIRLALDNSEIVCVVYGRLPPATVTDQDRRDPGLFLSYHPYYEAPNCWGPAIKKAPIAGPLMIHRVNADTPLWRFRAEAMALVRSVEQQYWVVSAQRVRVRCAEQVDKMATNVVNKMQAELVLSRGYPLDLAEATERVLEFRKDLETQTVRLTDADRRLRALLGLPKSDGRHIVTVTRPIDQPFACEWSQCRTEMVRMQANVFDKLIVKALCDATADTKAVPSSRRIEPRSAPTRAMREQQETREAKEWFDAIQRQIGALEGCCMAVNAGYQKYQQAKQQRIDAARRLEAQKTSYDEGRITIDRYFDFIGQHAEAVAAEADRASEYNTAIAALGEAKGTLLADRFILVIDQPLRMPKNWVDGPDKPEGPVKKATVEGP